MNGDEKEIKPRYGVVDFERRKHPRFKVDLLVEYTAGGPGAIAARAVNASEGGLLLWLPERVEIGRLLDVNLYLSLRSGLKTIAVQVRVVWTDIHLEGWGDYRTGVEFSAISAEDLEVLKSFLRSLSGG